MKLVRILSYIRRFAGRSCDIIYPPLCVACDEVLELGTAEKLCPICKTKWDTAKLSLRDKLGGVPVIPIVIDGIPEERASAIASLCDYHSNALEKDYEVQKKIVFALKRYEITRLTDFVADEIYRLAFEVLEGKIYKNTAVVRIPRNRRNLVRDGADSMKIVGKKVADKLGVEFFDCIKQKRGIKEQKRLSKAERATNIEKGIYIKSSFENKIKNRRVILLDDVVTTGSSVTTAAKMLYGAGARQVIIFSLTMNSEHLLRKQ